MKIQLPPDLNIPAPADASLQSHRHIITDNPDDELGYPNTFIAPRGKTQINETLWTEQSLRFRSGCLPGCRNRNRHILGHGNQLDPELPRNLRLFDTLGYGTAADDDTSDGTPFETLGTCLLALSTLPSPRATTSLQHGPPV